MDDSDLPHGFEVTFETAWSPPEEICSAIREQYPNVSISWFYDEPGVKSQGIYKWHFATYAGTLTTKRLKTTSVVFILASDQRDAKVINPTSITIGTHP